MNTGIFKKMRYGPEKMEKRGNWPDVSGRFFFILGIFVFVLFPFSSCRHEPEPVPALEMFLECISPGLVLSSGYAFEYDMHSCQRVFNENRKMIRLQTDDQEAYVNMIFKEWPLPQERAVEVKLNYTVSQHSRLVDLKMEVLKKEEGKCWLWDDSNKTGLIIFTGN